MHKFRHDVAAYFGNIFARFGHKQMMF